MAARHHQREEARSLLSREVGYVTKSHGGRLRVALAFPNTYFVGMSNLGFQTVYRLFNAHPEIVCERVFLPVRSDRAPQPSLRKRVPEDCNRLYRNLGNGTFADVTAKSGLCGTGYDMGAAVGDFDNDGRKDIFTANSHVNDMIGASSSDQYLLANSVFQNRDGKTFADVTAGSPELSTRSAAHRGAVAADLDGDGDLDVLVVTANNDWDNPGAPSLLWLENDGRMGFTARGLASSPTHLLTLSVGELDGDGKVDVAAGGMHISRPYDRIGRVTAWLTAGGRPR